MGDENEDDEDDEDYIPNDPDDDEETRYTSSGARYGTSWFKPVKEPQAGIRRNSW